MRPVSILILAVACGACSTESSDQGSSEKAAVQQEGGSDITGKPDPGNAIYEMDGQFVRLVNGVAEVPPLAPGSTVRERTSLAKILTRADVDGDGSEEAVVLLVHEAGGSGSYLSFAVAKGRRGTNTLSLGDRIGAPTARVERGIIQVSFLDRALEDSFADPPSVPRSVRAKLKHGRLIELPPKD